MSYSPSLGRWMQMDPLGYAAGDSNLYRFVHNGPTNATDPSGKVLLADAPNAEVTKKKEQIDELLKKLANGSQELADVQQLAKFLEDPDVGKYAKDKLDELKQKTKQEGEKAGADLKSAERKLVEAKDEEEKARKRREENKKKAVICDIVSSATVPGVRTLIGDLSSPQFDARRIATDRLVAIGKLNRKLVVDEINAALAQMPNLEAQRRIEDVLKKLGE
jgi:uncharacterized protein RhaS with RHS repeats